MTETWLAVPGYEGRYEVSDLGHVRSLERRSRYRGLATRHIQLRDLKPIKSTSGYLFVHLYAKGHSTQIRVHRLVLEAFVGPCPEGMEALHWDDDPENNRLVNLRWGTRSDNERDAVRNGGNFWRNKRHCPKNHELTGLNLREGSLRKGYRDCKACARERVAAKRQGREFDLEKSNERYRDILNGVDNRFTRTVN